MTVVCSVNVLTLGIDGDSLPDHLNGRKCGNMFCIGKLWFGEVLNS